jgi:DNA-directed RNA polymerase subunit L
VRGSRSEVGDTRVAKNGYHYTKTEERWRLTHHILMEEKLGRPLKENERVVFVDNDRTNLDLDNLEVRIKTTSTLRKKEANLVARITELQAQLEEVRKQIQRNMTAGEITEDESE